MPWKEATAMSERKEFVYCALQEGVNKGSLCRRYGISAKTGYKWLHRYRCQGEAGLVERSRRPKRCPHRTADHVEAAVLGIRDAHPAWGGRKIRRRLLDLGHSEVPSASTITAILRRNGRLNPETSGAPNAFRRFERRRANELWQMDFKGHFGLDTGGRCHPLTILDDYSRYAVCVQACPNQQLDTVQQTLIPVFRRYGLPEGMLMDNGSCWGHSLENRYTVLTVWLIRMGIGISHSRAYHPQTQGKNERFNRTLKTEVLGTRRFRDLRQCQNHFDLWRPVYNLERPHEALGLQPPIARYVPSPRTYPEVLPPIEYNGSDVVRTVKNNGRVRYKGREFNVGKPFAGYPVALRHTMEEHLMDVFFCHERIGAIDLSKGHPYSYAK